MHMAYSTNPALPKVRMEATKLVRSGWSTVKVARHLGYAQSTITKWCQRAPENNPWARAIPTCSSRPWHHPHELAPDLVRRIIEIRRERDQCAEVIHHRLVREGVAVSLSSVKRTLARNGLTYPSKWKKWHQYPARPLPEKPGVLMQIDSMQDGMPADHLHAYALVDACSRWGYAATVPRILTHASARFMENARHAASFPFATLQSDHGAEFSKMVHEAMRVPWHRTSPFPDTDANR